MQDWSKSALIAYIGKLEAELAKFNLNVMQEYGAMDYANSNKTTSEIDAIAMAACVKEIEVERAKWIKIHGGRS